VVVKCLLWDVWTRLEWREAEARGIIVHVRAWRRATRGSRRLFSRCRSDCLQGQMHR